MKHKSLKFHWVLVLALVLLVAIPALVRAEGEDDNYYAAVHATGYTPDYSSGCQVDFYYRNQFDYPDLHVFQYGWGPSGCLFLHEDYKGDDVPKDLISLKGPVDGWFADGSFDLDEFDWSFDITTFRTSTAEGKWTYYPSGDVSGYESRENHFSVNFFEVQGTYYVVSVDGQGWARKDEP